MKIEESKKPSRWRARQNRRRFGSYSRIALYIYSVDLKPDGHHCGGRHLLECKSTVRSDVRAPDTHEEPAGLALFWPFVLWNESSKILLQLWQAERKIKQLEQSVNHSRARPCLTNFISVTPMVEAFNLSIPSRSLEKYTVVIKALDPPSGTCILFASSCNCVYNTLLKPK